MTWNDIIPLVWPELVLIVTACALFLLGTVDKIAARKTAAALALVSLGAVFAGLLLADSTMLRADPLGAMRITQLTQFIKLLSAGVGVMFVLLAWPANRDGTGNSAMNVGGDGGEFFGLLLLSIAGVFIVAGANDMILLFLGLELASIPTYIMVSISRPLPAAQEAGVKYFFLGAMAAALMLFGFSYLYGTTGSIDLNQLTAHFAATAGDAMSPTVLTSWQMLAVLMLIGGFAFKMAAVPLHFYAGDVYEGAATPVTALLSFVPKASGLVALVKLLFVISGGGWMVPGQIAKLIWVIAVLSMFVGNLLGLRQENVKRLLANSSIAHSGYLLAGVAAALSAPAPNTAQIALQGVLFYLAAYGVMNVAAFGVLMLLPSRAHPQPATSAETFEDLAGTGRQHVGLGLAMAVACFSLTGLPLTVGFFGKLYLIRPALLTESYWLAILIVVNAVISAGYYLRIVGVMFLRPEPQTIGVDAPAQPAPAAPRATAVLLAVVLSAAGTLLFGVVLPATEVLNSRALDASAVDQRPIPASVIAQP